MSWFLTCGNQPNEAQWPQELGFATSVRLQLTTGTLVMSAQAPTLTGPGPEESIESSNPRRPVYQTETTGTYWGDVREAAKVGAPFTPPPPHCTSSVGRDSRLSSNHAAKAENIVR